MTVILAVIGIAAVVLSVVALVQVRNSRIDLAELGRTTHEENKQLTDSISRHAEDARRAEADLDGRVRQLESLPHELKTVREELRQFSLTAKGLGECSKCTRAVPVGSLNGSICFQCEKAA